MNSSVLVADGDRDCADRVTHFLKRHGVDTHCCYDGREAIALAQRVHPRHAILDVDLPIVSGADVVRALREAFGSSIRLVAYTATPANGERKPDGAFDAWVPKTIEPIELLRIVDKALHTLVMESIRVNVRQMRNQLTLSESLLAHVQSTQDAGVRHRLREFLATRIEGVIDEMAGLPMQASDRTTLCAEIEALRQRVERFSG